MFSLFLPFTDAMEAHACPAVVLLTFWTKKYSLNPMVWSIFYSGHAESSHVLNF